MASKKAQYLLLSLGALFLSQSARACWQDTPHIKISNDHVNVRLTYEGKPLSGAFVLLRNRKQNISLQSKVDEQGWVRFPKVPAGDYRLVMDGPSHENFDVVVTRSDSNARAIFISFSADYCSSVSLRNDPKFSDLYF